ncbi:hypothetical protein BCR35DRAFT_304555 [Leucosporidium creatinivorum]|uniref:Uncharacterized protein n=1 Tax=Leucosporidium creatinivorum TaxID=106004 RepID=A0A1Y2FA34_9BASI|nr:hypothetical protein BCR35DRAFT_304555 [Leucosporidium creatinivorum]
MQAASLAVLLAGVSSYVLYARKARYQRIKAAHVTYARRHGLAAPPLLTRPRGSKAPTRAELPMTPAEAQEFFVIPNLSFEMPFLMQKAFEFALFLTYGIESISEILESTREFLDLEKAGRRYTDTTLLIMSWVRYPIVGPGSGAPEGREGQPLDPRGAIAIARTRVLHSHYKITNDDMLYTLSTFILEPAKWAAAFDWRPFTPLEEMAFHVFFSETGRRLGITDIPEELQDLKDWAEAYEAANMLPSETCATVAAATTRLLLLSVPKRLIPFAEQVVATLLYDRLRESILVPAPPPLLRTLVHSTLHLRAFVIRHLFLPRRQSQGEKLVPDPEEYPAFPKGYIPLDQPLPEGGETAAMAEKKKEANFAPLAHPEQFYTEPWYMPEPTGFGALKAKLLLALKITGEDQTPSKRFRPDGYRLETLGPVKREGTELQTVQDLAEQIHGGRLEGPYAVGGAPKGRCPFAFAG